MSFTPNRYGPFCPTGLLTVAVPGTPIQLSSNWNASAVASPNAPVTAAAPVQYAIAFEDIIINSPPTNNGGLYLILYDAQGSTGGKGDPTTILLYIPKGSPPVSLKKFLGGSRFNASALAVDADQANDTAWITGIVGS